MKTLKRSVLWLPLIVAIVAGLMPLASPVLQASDHADPMILTDPNSNITGLFFFPKDDQMILILNVRRALTAPKPYDLAPYEYVVHMDLHTPVSFDKPDDRARYGGTIANPEGLTSDVTIRVHLNDDTTLKGAPVFEGRLTNTDRIRVYSGVRDDPFIFPRFFKRNVISMVFSIPMSSFPAGQQDWILWGSTYKDGKQLDHVGRSNRTQLARFDTLNPLPPTGHVAEIMKLMSSTGGLYTFLNKYQQTKALAGFVQYVLQIRKYDVATDVMIYTNRFPPGFPNGRRLPDDVAALTCATGDCILQELSYVEGGWPRAVVNDKPFSDEFPFLADPWPDMPEAPPAPSAFSMGFVIDAMKVLPEGMRLGVEFVGMPLLITGALVVFLLSGGLFQLLIRLVRWLVKKIRKPAMA
ncbi:MAG: DUF4331 domain-containing protein [Acidobacteriia bacterium]|nr:DUF4331 domain-containing protein [Terriglobia bacterium]